MYLYFLIIKIVSFFLPQLIIKRSKNKTSISYSKTRINNEFLLFSYSLIYLVVGNC